MSTDSGAGTRHCSFVSRFPRTRVRAAHGHESFDISTVELELSHFELSNLDLALFPVSEYAPAVLPLQDNERTMNLTPERWRQVARIYELAVDRDPATRDAFLTEACAGDETLRREVDSLLRQEGAQVVVDSPVWATAAPLFNDDPDLRPGAMLARTASKVRSAPEAWERSSTAPTLASIVEWPSRFFRSVPRSMSRCAPGSPAKHGRLQRSRTRTSARCTTSVVTIRSTTWSWSTSKVKRWPRDWAMDRCCWTRRLRMRTRSPAPSTMRIGTESSTGI